MFGVCPNCRTAYHWDVPRYGCQCGAMSDTPPAEAASPQYTSLGRSPWNGGMWRDMDPGDDRRRPAARPASGVGARDDVPERAAASERERDRDREREQRRRERSDDSFERRDRGRGRGNGGGRRGRGR